MLHLPDGFLNYALMSEWQPFPSEYLLLKLNIMTPKATSLLKNWIRVLIYFCLFGLIALLALYNN